MCRDGKDWLRGKDLNLRPLGYEPNELPDCSTPHLNGIARGGDRQEIRDQIETVLNRSRACCRKSAQSHSAQKTCSHPVSVPMLQRIAIRTTSPTRRKTQR